MKKNKNNILKYDARILAFHEAGHYLVASHFKLSASLRLWEIDGHDPRELLSVRGQTFFDHTTKFRKCAIAWGGMIGDTLKDGEFQSVKELADAVWYNNLDSDGDLSHSDQQGIQLHNQRWRAIKLASKIIYARRAELMEIVSQATSALLRNRRQEFIFPKTPLKKQPPRNTKS